MINLIKMEIYRMLRTRSLWVILGIMTFAIVFTTYIAGLETENGVQKQVYIGDAEDAEMLMEMAGAEDETLNIGMSVMVSTEPGEPITLYDMVYSNIQGKFIMLFLAIFTVIFSTADMNSGYIKNIGGQIARKSNLLFAKMVALAVFTVMTITLFIAAQAIGNLLFLDGIRLGNAAQFGRYLVAQTILHYALVVVCMMIAVVIRNNLISMIITICLCMNLMMVLYQAVGKVLLKLSGKEVNVLDYAVSTKISLLPKTMDMSELWQAVILALVYMVLFIVSGCLITKKRDIV